MAVHLSDTTNTKLTLRFRIFDDGLGFRYEYEVPGADSILVTDELTAFNIAQDGTSWSIPANYDTYELLYRTQPVSRIDNANTPMTFKTGGLYASIHEAALTDFPEMTLKNTGNCNFKSELAPWPDGIKARFNGGSFKTPWRTIQIAPKAVGLINSGGESHGASDLKDAVVTAVINKRAGGMGLISGRKAFQRPMKDGVELLHSIQDIYLYRYNCFQFCC